MSLSSKPEWQGYTHFEVGVDGNKASIKVCFNADGSNIDAANRQKAVTDYFNSKGCSVQGAKVYSPGATEPFVRPQDVCVVVAAKDAGRASEAVSALDSEIKAEQAAKEAALRANACSSFKP